MEGRCSERAEGPGLGCWPVADDDGDSPALLATTTTVGAFPCWPAATMTTWGKAELMNTLRKLGRTHVLSVK